MKLVLVAVLAVAFTADEPRGVALLKTQAEQLAPLVESDVARGFLEAVPTLPSIKPRVILYHPETRDAVTEKQAALRRDPKLAGYERKELDEHFYYFTRYGSPLAFARPLDLLGRAGVERADDLALLELGFGSIGQLRLLAGLGARTTGLEVDPLLRALYSEPQDTGDVGDGSVRLLYGQYPADADLTARVGGGYDVFISKNTLKRGYIHPEKEVDPRMLVHLGVDDETFVRAMHATLKPGGCAMIYNLHPAQATEGEPYIPWADGRCPFDRELLEACGFTVLAYDEDDTAAARTMGEALGWDRQMDLTTDLFATYTLLRK